MQTRLVDLAVRGRVGAQLELSLSAAAIVRSMFTMKVVANGLKRCSIGSDPGCPMAWATSVSIGPTIRGSRSSWRKAWSGQADGFPFSPRQKVEGGTSRTAIARSAHARLVVLLKGRSRVKRSAVPPCHHRRTDSAWKTCSHWWCRTRLRIHCNAARKHDGEGLSASSQQYGRQFDFAGSCSRSRSCPVKQAKPCRPHEIMRSDGIPINYRKK